MCVCVCMCAHARVCTGRWRWLCLANSDELKALRPGYVGRPGAMRGWTGLRPRRAGAVCTRAPAAPVGRGCRDESQRPWWGDLQQGQRQTSWAGRQRLRGARTRPARASQPGSRPGPERARETRTSAWAATAPGGQ